MNNKILTLSAICLLLITLLNTGCEKLIAIDPPLNEVSSTLAFATDNTAKSTLSGMFGLLSQSSTQNVNLTLYGSLQSDDLQYLSVATANLELMNNTYTLRSTVSTDQWNNWYNIIYQANAIIAGLQSSTTVSATVKQQLTAQATFVRAYCYFNLVNTFGDVPLVLETDVTKTAFLAREATAKVYQQIIADLLASKANLPADYSFTAGDRIGVNKFAATALLARIYLFVGQYQDAETNASEVIASSLYKIVPAADMGTKVFIKNSTECIWQMTAPLSSTNQYTAEAATFIPSTYTVARIQYKVRPDLISSFAATDLRLLRWINSVTVSGATYPIPFKYKYRSNTLAVAAGVNEQQVVLRLAEQYLIRAEARARIGSNLSGARDDMNVIRTRAQAAVSTTAVQAALLDEIALEYRKEYFCEQSFRWFNLKRTGQADAVLAALKPTYKPTSKLLPIPLDATNANPNLVQNPGYN